jgi:hypothetical protein
MIEVPSTAVTRSNFVGNDPRCLRALVQRYCLTRSDEVSALLSSPGRDRLIH